jgi:hypothetical protein
VSFNFPVTSVCTTTATIYSRTTKHEITRLILRWPPSKLGFFKIWCHYFNLITNTYIVAFLKYLNRCRFGGAFGVIFHGSLPWRAHCCQSVFLYEAAFLHKAAYEPGLALPAPLHLHWWPGGQAKSVFVIELVPLTRSNCVTYRSGERQQLIGTFMLTYRSDRNITRGYLLTGNTFSLFSKWTWGLTQ